MRLAIAPRDGFRARSTFPFPYKALGQNGPRQTFCYDKGIVAKRFEEFAQHLRLSGVIGHALHLSLKFAPSDWRSPSICDKLRFAQVLFDFVFDLTLRDNCIQWRFRPRILPVTAGPDPVSPIDFFHRILIRHALSDCERPTKCPWRLASRNCPKRPCSKGTRDGSAKEAGN
jgi:hypothetical protein